MLSADITQKTHCESTDVAPWHKWSGKDVATFVARFCKLPQYGTAISQNLTGAALGQLAAAGMLRKGLSRAGICDAEHQNQIVAAVGWLLQTPSEQLKELWDIQETEQRQTPRVPIVPCKKGKTGPFHRAHMRLIGSLAPRPQTPTEAALRTPLCVDGSFDSEERRTPRPFQLALAREIGDELCFVRPKLAEHLARTSHEYFEMKHQDVRAHVVAVAGVRGVQQLQAQQGRESARKSSQGTAPLVDGADWFKQVSHLPKHANEHLTATKIQSLYRSHREQARIQLMRNNSMKRRLVSCHRDLAPVVEGNSQTTRAETEALRAKPHDRKHVGKLEKELHSEQLLMEHTAAARIQAAYKGMQVRRTIGGTEGFYATPDGTCDVTEEELYAAIKVQSLFRQRQALCEAAGRRYKKNLENVAAVKIQAAFRGNTERRNVRFSMDPDECIELPHEHHARSLLHEDGALSQEEDCQEEQDEEHDWDEEEPRTPEEEYDDDDEELIELQHEAASRIQAVFRGSQTRRSVAEFLASEGEYMMNQDFYYDEHDANYYAEGHMMHDREDMMQEEEEEEIEEEEEEEVGEEKEVEEED